MSNAGSLAALWSYPLLVEPQLSLEAQARWWGIGYRVFALLVVVSGIQLVSRGGLRVSRSPLPASPPEAVPEERGRPQGVHATTYLAWLGFPAAASALLVATTARMSLEIAPVPFLWILPLSAYLLSFMLTFDRPHRYERRRYGMLLVGSALGVLVLLHGVFAPGPGVSMFLFTLSVFAASTVCHGELARLQPHPSRLTSFYLTIALAGVCGSAFTAIAAPFVFRGGAWEFHGSWILVLVLAGGAWVARGVASMRHGWKLAAVALVGWGLAVYGLIADMSSMRRGAVWESRSFFGAVRLEERVDDSGVYLALLHGEIIHGIQYVDPVRWDLPTTYYSRESGLGLALAAAIDRDAADSTGLRIGAVGLGAGTVAAYLRPMDSLRFYEIDPLVVRVAEQAFRYLARCRGSVDIALGDARLVLAEESARGNDPPLDVLIIDAFTGGAIPIHLLTAEAADLYWSRLDDDGILLIHVSNQYLDLSPVVLALAQRLGVRAARVSNPGDPTQGAFASDWIVLSRDPGFLEVSGILGVSTDLGESVQPERWTDDFASLWPVVRFSRPMLNL